MTTNSHRGGHGARRQGTAARTARPRSANGQFLSSTAIVLQRLYDATRQLGNDIGTHGDRYSTASTDRDTAVQVALDVNLPDIGVMTLARLKVKLPDFVNDEREAEAQAARTYTLGFFDSLCLDEEQERAGKVRTTLQEFRRDFKSTIIGLNTKPDWLSALGTAEATIASEDATIRKLQGELRNVNEQIRGLERVREVYARDGAPPPDPKLAEAVASSAAKAQAAPQPDAANGSGGDGAGRNTILPERREFSYVDDVLVPSILWNEVLGRNSDFHRHYRGDYDDSDYHPDRYHHREDLETYRSDTRPEGDAGGRMSEAAEVTEGGTGTRMADAAEAGEGGAGGRMADANPVIASPTEAAGGRMSEAADEPENDSTGAGKLAAT